MTKFADALKDIADAPKLTRLEAWFEKDEERREVRGEVLAARAAGVFQPAILKSLRKYEDFTFSENQLKDFLARHRGEVNDDIQRSTFA